MGLSFTVLCGAMKAAVAGIFPPQCPGCGAGVAEDGGLCPDCWRETEFIGGPACGHCGAPLPGPTGGGEAADDEALICDDCLATPRPWQRGRAAVVYAGAGRRLVLALKHGDRLDLVPVLGGWMAQAAAPLVQPGMLVVPVPIHPRRLLARKYNQAALLAARIARAHRLPLVPGALVRRRHTPMQDHASVADRFANLEGALAVPPAMQARLSGRPVLLVDDVMTSGATLAAATGALSDAGSGAVSVAVLARAVRGGRPAGDQGADA